MRKVIATMLVALLVAAVRFGLAAENRALTEKRAAASEQSSSTSEPQERSSFKLTVPEFLSRNKTVKALQLTAIDHQIVEGCLYNFKAQQMSFPTGIPTRDGCACSAKQITSRVDPDHFTALMKQHAIMLTGRRLYDLAPTNAAKKQVVTQNYAIYEAVLDRSDLPAKVFYDIGDIVEESYNLCARRQTYDAQSLVAIAELSPLVWENALSPDEGIPNAEVQLRSSQGSLQASRR